MSSTTTAQLRHSESMHLINCKCQRTECCGMTCQDKEPLDEYVIGSCYTNFEEPHTSDDGHTQITKDGRHQPEDKQAKCTYYTDPQVKHGVRGEEEDDGHTQTTKDGRHQNTGPEDEQVKCTCYIDSQVNKYLIKICKCQRAEGRSGMTCQDNESLNENVNGTCYIDYGEPQIIDTCGYKKPQHSCDCQNKNVKCGCHTSRGESKITITCGCKRPRQKYINENFEESKENCEENGENDEIRDENCKKK